jgi:hypothetical protein
MRSRITSRESARASNEPAMFAWLDQKHERVGRDHSDPDKENSGLVAESVAAEDQAAGVAS